MNEGYERQMVAAMVEEMIARDGFDPDDEELTDGDRENYSRLAGDLVRKIKPIIEQIEVSAYGEGHWA